MHSRLAQQQVDPAFNGPEFLALPSREVPSVTVIVQAVESLPGHDSEVRETNQPRKGGMLT